MIIMENDLLGNESENELIFFCSYKSYSVFFFKAEYEFIIEISLQKY